MEVIYLIMINDLAYGAYFDLTILIESNDLKDSEVWIKCKMTDHARMTFLKGKYKIEIIRTFLNTTKK